MFSHSIALVSTNDKNWFAHMRALMRQAGLKETKSFPKSPVALAQFKSGPLPFIFVDSSLPGDDIKRVFSAVRGHTELPVRFLPMIVLTESREAQAIMRFIHMGCDDVVMLPLTAAALIERLKRQVAPARTYFQTESYFGPDRREHELSTGGQHDGRGKGDHFFRHFTIERSLQNGISILSSEVHRPGTEQIVLPI